MHRKGRGRARKPKFLRIYFLSDPDDVVRIIFVNE